MIKNGVWMIDQNKYKEGILNTKLIGTRWVFKLKKDGTH